MTTTNNGATSAPPKTPPNQALQRVQSLEQVLGEDFVKNQLEKALGGENAAGFQASIIELFTGDKYLQECDPKRLVFEAMKAAALRLPINKTLGFAWIVAYKKIPAFQVGYKGLIQLAIRSGQYKTINCGEVYEGELKASDKVTGEINISGVKTSDKVVGYFAYMELKNGFSKTLFSTVAQVTAHAKKYSKSFNVDGSAWKTDFDAMGKKTLVRNMLSKWGILSVEMVKAIEADVDTDAADRVMDEIRGKGNSKNTGFTDAEVVPPMGDDGGEGATDGGPNW